MSSEMFEELRQKLFHTNLSFFDKAIERAKTGKKEQSFEAQYLTEIDKNVTSLQKQIDVLTDNLEFYQAFFSSLKPESIQNLRFDREKFAKFRKLFATRQRREDKQKQERQSKLNHRPTAGEAIISRIKPVQEVEEEDD